MNWRCALGLGLMLGLGVMPVPATATDRAAIHPTGAAASAVGAYLAGRYARHIDDWRSAAAFLADALARDPDTPDLLVQAFKLALSTGDDQRAMALARRLVARKIPGTPFAHLLMVAAAVKAGDYDDATARLAALPHNRVLRIARPLIDAWLIAGAGEPERAIARLDARTSGAGLVALHALHAGLIAEAAGDLTTAASRYRNAYRAARDSLRILQAFGGFLMRRGKPDQAAALWAEAIERSPEHARLAPIFVTSPGDADAADRGAAPPPLATSPAEGIAEALFDLASALQRDRGETDALALIRVSLVLRPSSGVARLLVADLYGERGRHDEALAVLATLDDRPGLAWVVGLRTAETLRALDRAGEAEALLLTLAREHPNRIESHTELGDLFRSRGRYAEAAAAYTAALDVLPADSARRWPILYGRALAHDRMGDWNRAETDLEAALARRPDHPILLNYLGYSWADRGIHLPRARRMIARAAQRRPNDGYIIDSLGWVLYRLGDLDGAITHLERAVELQPYDSTINDHLGDAYWAVGRHVEAIYQWRRALTMAEDEDEARAAIADKLAGRNRPERRVSDRSGPSAP